MDDRIVRLAILDTYGVRWSRETFARDVLQNFFDSTADFRDISIDVRPAQRFVEIRGPVPFDLDLLAYIGATTKTTGQTVGGFGEGFKICALVGIRDFGLTMTAGTGEDELVVFLDPVPLGRELCYRVSRRSGPAVGSFVRLEGCDAATIAAFEAAPSMFRHPDNKKLRTVVIEDAAQGVALYAGTDSRSGEIYYRRQLRGRVSFYASSGHRPVTLVHDGAIDALEGDRDRRDVAAEPVARAIGKKLEPGRLCEALLYLMPYWQYGNDALRGLLDAAVERTLRFDWPRGWLARSDAKHLMAFAERQGFKIALRDFASIGMRTPEEHYRGDLETRPPEPLERARIQVVADLYAELSGAPARTNEFEVFDLGEAAVMGQHLGSKVIVGAQLLAGDLDGAAGTILHELAHEAGGEKDRRFLNKLTRLLGAAIREPELIRATRRRYAAAKAVELEPRREPSETSRKEDKTKARYEPHGPGEKAWDQNGVSCVLVVPPAFPPSEAILNAIQAAGAATGIGVCVTPMVAHGPREATSWLAPGLPTLWIAGFDPEPPPSDQAEPGYRLRTYGAHGERLWPSEAALQEAIAGAKRAGLSGTKGHHANFKIRDQLGWPAVAARFGAEGTPLYWRKQPSAREKRDSAVKDKIVKFAGDTHVFSLRDFWGLGMHLAAERRLQRYRRSHRSADAVWGEIKAWLDRAKATSRRLRREDADFDDASEFERHAMAAAQGAAVLAFAADRDDGSAERRAEDHFRAVRAMTKAVLELDVVLDAKTAIVMGTLERAGFDDTRKRLDLAKLGVELKRICDVAVKFQQTSDDDGLPVTSYTLECIIDDMEGSTQARELAAQARQEKRQIRATWAVKKVYDEALAASGNMVLAASKCLEEAGRRLPEKKP